MNNLFSFFGIDARLRDLVHPYLNFKPNKAASKSKQAGYTDEDKVSEALSAIKAELKDLIAHLPINSRILDVGCGPGQFLELFGEEHELIGLDISEKMIDMAKSQIPNGKFYVGDFVKSDFEAAHFDLVYSIGVLIYFTKSELKKVLEKMENCVKSGGYIFISYPHAISLMDLLYNDYTYVQYSPVTLEKMLPSSFTVIKHYHCVERQFIGCFDKKAIYDGSKYKGRTYFNSSVMIAKKN